MDPRAVVEQACSLVAEICRAMCKHPEQLTVEASREESQVMFQITGNPNDTRRIVGKGAEHLCALAAMARLLFYGSRKMAKFYPLKSTDAPEEERAPWIPDSELWAERRPSVEKLMMELACAVFATSAIRLDRDVHISHSTYTVVVSGGQVTEVTIDRFGNALSTLMAQIGKSNGHQLYALVSFTRPA